MQSDLTSLTAPRRKRPQKPMRRLARRMLRPVELFLRIEAASGIVLLVAAVVALGWANSPWAASYDALWSAPVSLHLPWFSFERDLRFVVNDGLMTIFFFVVGLEIRREIAGGELSDLRRAALPLAAALGGMLVPAAIFAGLNHGRETSSGWGIPMATDIAFAVGVLALLGKRVPSALRVLLLALAVIDDIGAIAVIAVFYSTGFSWVGLGAALAGVLGIAVFKKLGVRSTAAYFVPAIAVWAGLYGAGVHPTLAGVIVGMMTPAAPLDDATPAPLERLERALHSPVAFGVMPLFALANSGVGFANAGLEADALRVALGIGLGLLVGKALGIFGAAFAAERIGVVRLPRGVGWSALLVVGLVGGIGFTMSIFIAGLAFPPGVHLETAKLAILVSSASAALVGLLVGRMVLPAPERSAHT